jgi:hypothetical protein
MRIQSEFLSAQSKKLAVVQRARVLVATALKCFPLIFEGQTLSGVVPTPEKAI